MLSDEMDVQRTRWHLAALKVELKLLCLKLAVRAYNPGQPRVPAGHPDGGQWTIGDDLTSNDSVDDARLIFVGSDNNQRYSVALDEEDNKFGGHTLKEHVGKSDEEMLDVVRKNSWRTWIAHGGTRRNGSFDSKESANDFINRTLERNPELVDEVANGQRESAFIKGRFGYRTGREAYNNDNERIYIRDTYSVGVLIYHDTRSPRGYHVETAYPRNDGD